jgi:hypothetical protein
MRMAFRSFACAIALVFSQIFTTPGSAQPTSFEEASLLQDIYYDEHGLIVHRRSDGTFDGGDTAQREGWYWFGVWIRQNTPGLEPWTPTRKLNFDEVLELLEPNQDGVLYRHPKQPPFNNPHSKEWGLSRDQLTPLIAAMGVWGKHDTIRRVWEALPESQLGKHSFNGNYRNALGQDGADCMSIKKRDCSAEGDCSLSVDNRDCSLNLDTRDCSANHDTRDCSANHDTRDCKATILGVEVNDLVCEAAKAAQNKIYAADKIACEAAKATQNGIYAADKAKCEAEKGAQNALYAADKTKCESEKSAQNAIYSAEKATCEAGKTSRKYTCELDKQAAYQLCRVSHVHSGDIIGPQMLNFFRRALNEEPGTVISSLTGATIIDYLNLGGDAGELELLVNSHLAAGHARGNRDEADDLNHIVKLLMAEIRYPTALSNEATRVYMQQRPHSYGSYFGAYYAKHGGDFADIVGRMEAGIASGWAPDVPAAYGTVRWYHRFDMGANPQLATMYGPIIETLLK